MPSNYNYMIVDGDLVHAKKQTKYEDQLEHGLFGSTKKRKGAKYIAKLPIGGGKYRYFYTEAELRAYQAAKKVSGKINNAKEAVSDASGRKYYKRANQLNKEAKEYKPAYDKTKKEVEELKAKATAKAKRQGAPEGTQSWTKKEMNTYKKATDKHEKAMLDYEGKKYASDYNKRKGDESLYGKSKKIQQESKKQIKKAKKQIKKGKKKISNFLKELNEKR